MFHSCSHLAPMVYHEASGVCYVSNHYAFHAHLSSDPNLHPRHPCRIQILSYGQKASLVGKGWEDA